MNDGGPAFPVVINSNHEEHFNGMSLRDYLAGQALAGLLANDPKNVTETGTQYLELVAKGCYAQADAMLAARGPQWEGTIPHADGAKHGDDK